MKSKELNTLFSSWCNLTGRSGGVLIGRSMREFFSFVEDYEERTAVKEEKWVCVGKLAHDITYNGLDIFRKETPVYSMGDKYRINNGKVSVDYYKDTLRPYIHFSKS